MLKRILSVLAFATFAASAVPSSAGSDAGNGVRPSVGASTVNAVPLNCWSCNCVPNPQGTIHCDICCDK